MLDTIVLLYFRSMHDFFLNKRTDKEQALAVLELVENWKLVDKVQAVSNINVNILTG